MKKTGKKLLALIIVAVLTLSVALSAFAATEIRDDENGMSMSLSDSWAVYGTDEELDKLILKGAGVNKEAFEESLKNDNVSYIAYSTKVNACFFNSILNDASSQPDLFTWEEDAIKTTVNRIAKMFEENYTDISSEVYYVDDIPYGLFSYGYEEQGDTYYFIYAFTTLNSKQYCYYINLADKENVEGQLEEMKAILDSVQYDYVTKLKEEELAKKNTPVVHDFDDIGIHITLDGTWYSTGQDVDKDNPILEVFDDGIEGYDGTEKDMESFMTDYGYYAFAIDEEWNRELAIRVVNYENYIDFDTYSKSELNKLKDNVVKGITDYSNTGDYGEVEIIYSDCYKTKNAAYVIVWDQYEYDNETYVELYADTIKNGVMYTIYYGEYSQDISFGSNDDDAIEEVIENFEDILDKISYSEPTIELPKPDTLNLAEDVQILLSMTPYYDGLTKNYFAHFSLLAIALGFVFAVALVVSLIVFICFSVGKAKRRRRAAKAAASAQNE